jgi:formylglycine-generating enzyme required for sulfatase activity
VTNAEWARFLDATGRPKPEGSPLTGPLEPDRPVTNVSWDDAILYAAWAGASLPTEAQWERAARGIERRLFPWGNAWGPEGEWIYRQHYYRPWPSRDHPELASPDEVLDLVTRRWEWCADELVADEAEQRALTTLSRGLHPDGRVCRGGKGELLVACGLSRTAMPPSWSFEGTCFRLARAA